ncbi:hypothetical protein GGI42DRAFT_367540 [Trichoderma sp. SZMC 28013]
MGPDGQIEAVMETQVYETAHDATNPCIDLTDNSIHSSPRPPSSRSYSMTDREILQNSDIGQCDAPSPHHFAEPAIPNETVANSDPSSFSLGSATGDSGGLNNDEDKVENVDEVNDEIVEITSTKIYHDPHSSEKSQHEIVSNSWPSNVTDLTGPESHDAGNETSVQQQKAAASPALQLLYDVNTLMPAELDDLCVFFLICQGGLQSGHAIPGTNQRLSLAQLAFILQTMKKSMDNDDQPQGQLLADVTGLGKTHCAMGLLAVARLLLLSQQHFLEHPELHNDSSSTEPCPASDPYGIQCVCVAGSLGSRYVRRLIGGPLLILSPGHLVEQWIAKAADYFQPEITLRGSQITQAFVELVSWSDGHLVSHQFAEPGVNAVAERVPFSPARLTVNISAEPSTLPKSVVKTALQDTNRTHTIRWLRDKKGVTFRADIEACMETDQSRFVVMISANVFSLGRSLDYAFQQPVSLYYSGRASAVTLQFPLSITPSILVYDECHSIKSEGTEFWKRIRDLHRLTNSGDRRTQWTFLSATPFASKPGDLESIFGVLFHTPEQVKKINSRLAEFNSRFQKIQAAPDNTDEAEALKNSLAQDFAKQFARFLEPMIIARHGNSPILDRTVGGSEQGYTKTTTMITIPNHLLGHVEALGERCREGLRRSRVAPDKQTLQMLSRILVFTQYFCAGIMPGLATAQLRSNEESESYPSRAEEIEDDIAKGPQGIMRRSVHLHHNHAWLREMRAILIKAHNDRGQDSSERTKHVVVIAATPSLAGHLEVILREEPQLRENMVFHRISSKGRGSSTLRNENINLIKQHALSSNKTHVVISTASLLATGIDALTFCSYLVIFGELFQSYHEAQAVGRIRRQGQQFPTRVFHIRSTHDTHNLVRHRNKGRQTLLSDFGYADK